MDNLDVDGLARSLEGHLDPTLIQNLKDQFLTGVSFMGLTGNTLKLFDFPIGHIIPIIQIINVIKAGNIVLVDPKACSDSANPASSDSEDEDDRTESDVEADNVLASLVKEEYLSKLSDYTKLNLRGRVKSWLHLSKAIDSSNHNRPSYHQQTKSARGPR